MRRELKKTCSASQAFETFHLKIFYIVSWKR